MKLFYKLGIATITLLTIAGCKESDTLQQRAREALDRLQNNGLVLYTTCPFDAMFTVSTCEVRVRQGPFPPTPKSLIDVGMVTIQMQSQGAIVPNGTGTANVSLLVGSATVATTTFGVTVSNGTIQFADPGSVNAWMLGYEFADGFDVTVSVGVTSTSGQNTITASPAITGVSFGSSSASWFAAGGGEFSPTPPSNQ